MNNSIVDYLNSKGQASDYGSRSSLYSSSGLTGNYTGSADQNIQLLNTLKAKAPVDPATQTGGSTNNASMGTISIDKLQPATQMKTVDAPKDTTNYSSMIGATTKSIIDSYTNANNDYTTYSNKVVEDANSITSLMKQLAKDKPVDTQNAQETAGVNTAKAEYTNYINQLADLSGQATALQRESQAIPLKMQQGAEGKGITDAGLAPLTSAELRNNAIKALTLAQNTDVVSAAATGSYNKLQLAQEKAQQIIDLKYKPLEDDLKARQVQYELNKDMLSMYDKKRTEALGIALENEKTQLDAKKTIDQQKSTLQIEMAKNGAPADAITRVGNSANISEAIANATIYLRTPNTEVVKVGDNSAYLIDKNTGKIIRSFGGGGGSPTTYPSGQTITYTDVNGNTKTTDYNGIVNTILGSGKFTKDQSNAIRTAIAQGEDPVTVIKNNAKNLLSGTNQNALEDAEASLYQLKQLDANMTAYYNAGGNTGIFKGTYEETLNRLGEVKDPKLVELASRIATNLQEYRNAISGTAYGIKEGQEIASVFPSIKNGKVLNDTLVKARTDGLQAKIDGYYRSTIGDTGLSLIKGATTQKQSSVITSKGNLSDRDYVEKVLSSRNLKYDDVVNYVLDQAKASGIKQPMPVIDNASGLYGAVEYSDYVANKSKYTAL